MLKSVLRWWRFQRSRLSRVWASLTLGRLARRFQTGLEWLWFIIKYPFYLIARFFSAVWRAMASAWTQKHIRYFLQGLPALLAMLVIGVTSAFAVLRGGKGLADLYQREGRNAYNSQQLDRAKLCYERLAQLLPRDPEVRYNLADTLSLLKKGQPDPYVQSLITDLAPIDRGDGFARAHYWEARRLVFRGTNADGANRGEHLAKAEKHLQRALNPSIVPPLGEREALMAKELLGVVYLQLRRPRDAEPYLREVSAVNPNQCINLALIYRERGRPDLARAEAKRAADYFKGLAEANIDNWEARLSWSRALVEMEQHQEAVVVLKKGQEFNRGNLAYRNELSNVFLRWAVYVRQKDDKALGEYLGLLQQALREDPANGQALQLLVDLTRSSSPQGLEAKRELRAVLARAGNSALVHFAVGVVAYEEGNMKEAAFHWEQAYKLDYDMAIAANNLAWILANQEPIDLRRALEISSGVIKANPDIGLFYGTRGFVLYKLGRYPEAITDLEKSLKDNERNPELNDFLADCYEKIENKSMAEQHRKVAASKRQQAIEAAQGQRRN